MRLLQGIVNELHNFATASNEKDLTQSEKPLVDYIKALHKVYVTDKKMLDNQPAVAMIRMIIFQVGRLLSRIPERPQGGGLWDVYVNSYVHGKLYDDIKGCLKKYREDDAYKVVRERVDVSGMSSGIDTVNLSFYDISVSTLRDIKKKYPLLKKLYLTSIELDQVLLKHYYSEKLRAKLSMFLGVLETFTSLEYLDLSYNMIIPLNRKEVIRAAREWGSAISKLTQLKALNMSGNGINDPFFLSFWDACRHNTLEYLNLSGNFLELNQGDEGSDSSEDDGLAVEGSIDTREKLLTDLLRKRVVVDLSCNYITGEKCKVTAFGITNTKRDKSNNKKHQKMVKNHETNVISGRSIMFVTKGGRWFICAQRKNQEGVLWTHEITNTKNKNILNTIAAGHDSKNLRKQDEPWDCYLLLEKDETKLKDIAKGYRNVIVNEKDESPFDRYENLRASAESNMESLMY